MLVSNKTNRSEQDIVGIRGIAERAYREVLDVHALATQGIRRLEDCEKKLQVVDTIQGLQAKFEQMFITFMSKCDAIAKKQEGLDKNIQLSREEFSASSSKFQESQRSFREISTQFNLLKETGKGEFQKLSDLHYAFQEMVRKEWNGKIQALCEQMVVSPREVFDQNEMHNERMSKILESVELMNDENRKIKIGMRVLENKIETVMKKGA